MIGISVRCFVFRIRTFDIDDTKLRFADTRLRFPETKLRFADTKLRFSETKLRYCIYEASLYGHEASVLRDEASVCGHEASLKKDEVSLKKDEVSCKKAQNSVEFNQIRAFSVKSRVLGINLLCYTALTSLFEKGSALIGFVNYFTVAACGFGADVSDDDFAVFFSSFKGVDIPF